MPRSYGVDDSYYNTYQKVFDLFVANQNKSLSFTEIKNAVGTNDKTLTKILKDLSQYHIDKKRKEYQVRPLNLPEIQKTRKFRKTILSADIPIETKLLILLPHYEYYSTKILLQLIYNNSSTFSFISRKFLENFRNDMSLLNESDRTSFLQLLPKRLNYPIETRDKKIYQNWLDYNNPHKTPKTSSRPTTSQLKKKAIRV